MGLMYISKLLFFKHAQAKLIQIRFMYTVHHNMNRGLFYIKLTNNDRAVLTYKPDGRILDMRSIIIPEGHKGQGLARLLAETAFTYAIINNYYMYLTCEYLQKYYLATKTLEFEERVVGPIHILEGPDSEALDPDIIYELPDPEEFDVFPESHKK